MRALRVGMIVVILGAFTFALMPLQWLAIRRNWPIAARLPWYWQRLACRVVGIRVHAFGAPAAPPLLIAANHVSWLDITVLGSVLPVSYVAKSEVAGWPILGTLARLQRTIFIDRTRRTETASATAAIGRRVGRGESIVLFAEGTTGDGNIVLPFRSALLGAAGAAAGEAAITVQPVAIAYTALQGIPVGYIDRPGIGWYGDMPFFPHFYELAGRGAIDAVVAFGEPIAFAASTDRKKVAAECYQSVRRMVEEARRRPLPLNGQRRRLFSRQGWGGLRAPATRPAAGEAAGESMAGRLT